VEAGVEFRIFTVPPEQIGELLITPGACAVEYTVTSAVVLTVDPHPNAAVRR
jgi:hypothetical protein